MRITKMQNLKNKAWEATGESIIFVDVLERIYNKTRGQNNTACLITAAKKHNGLIICHTAEWASKLHDTHGIHTMVYTDPRIRTFDGPVFMDMPAMYEFVKAHARLEKTYREKNFAAQSPLLSVNVSKPLRLIPKPKPLP